jgi:hypothetical protein
MTWIALQLVGAAIATAAGASAARRSQRHATPVVGSMLLVILLKNALSFIPLGEPRFLPWNWYPLVERWWYLFPAMVIFGAGITLFRSSMWRRDVLLIGAGLLIVHSAALGWVMSHPPDLRGRIGEDGICLQTSGFSCTAASAVMLLYRHGIITTEREMADLSVTSPCGFDGGGTTESGLMRGLRLKVNGRMSVRIACPSLDRLVAPSIVGIRLSPRLSHSIVVVGVTSTEVSILDPLYGRGTLLRPMFEREWMGSAVWIE